MNNVVCDIQPLALDNSILVKVHASLHITLRSSEISLSWEAYSSLLSLTDFSFELQGVRFNELVNFELFHSEAIKDLVLPIRPVHWSFK